MLTYARNFISLKLGQRTLDPRLAIYYVTEQCNLNCSYCEDFGARRNHEFINPSFDDAKKILTIIRDGGIKGVVVRLGPSFAKVTTGGLTVRAGTAALDNKVAKEAAKAGIAGLEFYAGIPGTIGGALRMNAGCYGTETKDVLVEAIALDRSGRRQVMPLEELGYSYRSSTAPSDLIFIEAVFKGTADDPAAITARMEEITARREESQPIREKTGGSTFKNPDQTQSGGRGAWKVIDDAGGRGFKVGGAQMSEKHCNFRINTGDATAADLEELGETMIRKVKETQCVDLEWEVKRIGERA